VVCYAGRYIKRKNQHVAKQNILQQIAGRSLFGQKINISYPHGDEFIIKTLLIVFLQQIKVLIPTMQLNQTLLDALAFDKFEITTFAH